MGCRPQHPSDGPQWYDQPTSPERSAETKMRRFRSLGSTGTGGKVQSVAAIRRPLVTPSRHPQNLIEAAALLLGPPSARHPRTWIIIAEPLRRDESGRFYSEGAAWGPLGVTSKAKWKAGRSSPGWSCA